MKSRGRLRRPPADTETNVPPARVSGATRARARALVL